MRWRLPIVALFVILALAACGGVAPTPTIAVSPTPTACSTREGKKVYDLLKQTAQEWDDAVKLADSTPRMQLAAQVQQLQKIRRDVQAQQYPDCGKTAQASLVTYMDTTIEGFIAFLANKPEADVTAIFNRAVTQQTMFVDEMFKVAR